MRFAISNTEYILSPVKFRSLSTEAKTRGYSSNSKTFHLKLVLKI